MYTEGAGPGPSELTPCTIASAWANDGEQPEHLLQILMTLSKARSHFMAVGLEGFIEVDVFC